MSNINVTVVFIFLFCSSFAEDAFNEQIDELLDKKREELKAIALEPFQIEDDLPNDVKVTVNNGVLNGLDSTVREGDSSIEEKDRVRQYAVNLRAENVNYFTQATVESSDSVYVINYKGGMSAIDYEIMFATIDGTFEESLFSVTETDVQGYWTSVGYVVKVGEPVVNRQLVRKIGFKAREKLSAKLNNYIREVIKERIEAGNIFHLNFV